MPDTIFPPITLEDAYRRVNEAAYSTDAIARDPIVLDEASMNWIGEHDRRCMDVRFEVFADAPEEARAQCELVFNALDSVQDMKRIKGSIDGATLVVRFMYFAERRLSAT